MLHPCTFLMSLELRITVQMLIRSVIFANILEKFSVFEITVLDTGRHMYVQFTSYGQRVEASLKYLGFDWRFN